jgi:hypothetical protein
MKWRPTPSPKWAAGLILLAAAMLYLSTLDTGLRPDELTGGDLITHQYAQVQARPSNAPGYPLYTMLGWLSFRVARVALNWVFNPVQLLSLYSVGWGLASLWMLFWLLYRREVSHQNWLIATLLSLFYASTYFFWYYSVTTEQYTSAIFQTLLLTWLAFEWEARPTNHTLWLLALVSGTMAANMLTTLFILPPLLYLIFSKRPEILKNIKLMLQTTLIGLLPLTSYSYVYLRGAQHPEWRGQGDWASTWDWFIQFVSTQQGRDELAPGLTLTNLITPEFPALIWGELTWPILLAGLIGLGLLGRRMGIFFFGTLIIYAIFVTGYRFGNWFQVILPVYPLLILGVGRVVAGLWARPSLPNPTAPSQSPPMGGRFRDWGVRAILLFALLLLLTYRFTASWPRANQRHLPTDTGLLPGWAILADLPAPEATISATFSEWVALQYLTEIWQAQPAVQLVEPGSSAEYVTRQAAQAFPALIDPGAIFPQSVGANLIHLQTQPTLALPAAATPADLRFGAQLQLLGYQFADQGQTALLYWTALQPLTVDYTISVRLWQNGQPIETEAGPLIQDHGPVWNTYPTRYWSPDHIVADAYAFELPPHGQPTQMQVVVYQATEAGFENLGDGLVTLAQ